MIIHDPFSKQLKFLSFRSKKGGLKDKDQDLAKGQQQTAGDPVAGDLVAPEPTPGEEPKRKPIKVGLLMTGGAGEDISYC